MKVKKVQHSRVEPKEGDTPVPLRNSERSEGVREVCGQEHKYSLLKGWPACCRGPGEVTTLHTIWSVRKSPRGTSAKVCCLLRDGEATFWEQRQ